jgi:hypothetical protein
MREGPQWFGHRAVGAPRAAEEYTRAILENPQAVCSTDDWQLTRTGKVRATGELLVDGFQ